MKGTVSSRGQITLPKGVRERYERRVVRRADGPKTASKVNKMIIAVDADLFDSGVEEGPTLLEPGP